MCKHEMEKKIIMNTKTFILNRLLPSKVVQISCILFKILTASGTGFTLLCWYWWVNSCLHMPCLVLSALSWYLRFCQYDFKRSCVNALTLKEPCCVITRIVITRTYIEQIIMFFSLERGGGEIKKTVYDFIDVNVFHRNLKRFHCTKGV